MKPVVCRYIPSTSDPCERVTYGIPTTGDEDQWIGRIDWVRNQKHSIYGRYFVVDYRNPAVWDPANILVTTNPGNLERAQSFTLGDTYSFGLATLNSFHATFTRRRDDRGPNPQDINVRNLGVNIAVAVPDDMRLGVANAFNVGCGTCAPGHFNVNTFQFADDVDIIRGRHSISFGVDFIRTQNNTLSGYLQNGNFNFGGLYTGDPMADFPAARITPSPARDWTGQIWPTARPCTRLRSAPICNGSVRRPSRKTLPELSAIWDATHCAVRAKST